MKNNKITIGQMAKLNHTTLATLRLYDEKGLLKPIEVNPKSNYSIYDVRQSMVFHMIQHNKDLGMSLKEIAAVLDKSSMQFLADTYRSKLIALDEQIDELQWQKKEIQSVLHWNDYFSHRPPNGTLTIGYIPSCRACVRTAVRDYFQEDFGSVVYDLSCMEGKLRQKGIRGMSPARSSASLMRRISARPPKPCASRCLSKEMTAARLQQKAYPVDPSQHATLSLPHAVFYLQQQ